jgi:paraquat-inducible protein B
MKLKDSTSIGLFVVGGVLAFIAAVLLFTTGPLFGGRTHTFVLYFNESINGLEVGAPVKLRGVRIGQVKRILAHFDPTRKCVQVPVTIALEDVYFRAGRRERLRLVREDREKYFGDTEGGTLSPNSAFCRSPLIVGMVGSLQMESFVTGKLFVDLEYAPTPAGSYLRPDGDGVPEIPTKPSNLESLSDQLTAIAESLSRINFSAIGDSVEHMVAAMAMIDWISLSRSVTNLATGLNAAVSGEDTQRAVHHLAELSCYLTELVGAVNGQILPVLPTLRCVFDGVANSVDGLATLLHRDSRFSTFAEQSLRSINSAARAVQLFFEFLEQNPKAILSGRADEELP